MAHINNGFRNIFGFHQLLTLLINNLTLVIHNIIIFQQIFTDIKVALFHLLLSLFQGLADPRVNQSLALRQTQTLQHGAHPLRAEDAHQVIFQR